MENFQFWISITASVWLIFWALIMDVNSGNLFYGKLVFKVFPFAIGLALLFSILKVGHVL